MKKSLVALAVVASMPVYSHTLNQRECVRFAADMYAVAVDLEQGKQEAWLQMEADKGIPECMKESPTCLYKDKEDTMRAKAAISWVARANGQGMPAAQIANMISTKCQASSK